jgi:hypothetical protein
MRRRKKIACFSIAGVLICASVAYGYSKKNAQARVGGTKSAEAKMKSAAADGIENSQIALATDSQGEISLIAQQQDLAQVQQIPAQQQTVPVATAAQNVSNYPLHAGISTTYFWAGEEAGKDNKNISNLPSAWDDDWVRHFGGVDNPKKRNGLVVANFEPKENSFYFALPYNDFDENGNRKKDVGKVIPWANSKKWGAMESMCKNQWIKIIKGGKVAYAQWADVGPFGEDDSAYVFGGAKPKSKTNDDAGLDVSPAVKDYLGLGDMDKTDWQFVDASQVPDGPWKKTVTSTQISWN